MTEHATKVFSCHSKFDATNMKQCLLQLQQYCFHNKKNLNRDLMVKKKCLDF